MQGGSKSKPLSKIVITSYQILSVMLVFSSVSSIKWAQEYYKFVLNILCVTYFVTLSATVFEAAIWVKSWLKTRKKEEMWKSKNLYINLDLKYGLGMEFTADTRGALTLFTMCYACRYFAGREKLLTSQNRSRAEYLISDWHVNLTKNILSNWQALIRFF